MTAYRKLVVLVLALLLLGGSWAIWNADQKLKREEAWRRQQATVKTTDSMTGQNVSFIVTEGKVKKWKLEATQAVYSENKAQATLTEVKGEFYNAAGKPILHFTAPKGVYTSKTNTVTLSGGVVAQSAQSTEEGGQGGLLKAPTMHWSSQSDWVTANGGAELSFPQGKSTAQTCRFTLDFSNISLEGGVSSSLSPL